MIDIILYIIFYYLYIYIFIFILYIVIQFTKLFERYIESKKCKHIWKYTVYSRDTYIIRNLKKMILIEEEKTWYIKRCTLCNKKENKWYIQITKKAIK